MNKTKSMVVLLIHIALAVFVVVMILPVLKGDGDGYSGAVAVVPKIVEPLSEEAEPETMVETLTAVVEDAKPETMAAAETVIAELKSEAVSETVTSVVEETVVPSSDVVSESAGSAVENDDESALYSVVDGNKLDANSYAGFKLYRNWCARCHGTYGQGMVGPNLADSLKVITEKEFFNTVTNGKAGTIGSMPAWKANVKVMTGRDQLYAYLMARSDGAIGMEKPKKQ